MAAFTPAPAATDAELVAAMMTTAVPATMVELICGDHEIIKGHVVVGDEIECPACETDCLVVGAFPTFIV